MLWGVVPGSQQHPSLVRRAGSAFAPTKTQIALGLLSPFIPDITLSSLASFLSFVYGRTLRYDHSCELITKMEGLNDQLQMLIKVVVMRLILGGSAFRPL
jgi:hypothetical protein